MLVMFSEMAEPSQSELPVDQEVDDDEDSAVQSQVQLTAMCFLPRDAMLAQY